MSRLYRVRHRTRYTYDEDVTASYGRLCLTPRDDVPGQECLSSELSVSPTPTLLTHSEDYFGNRCAYLELHTPHRELEVTAASVIRVERAVPDLRAVDDWSWGEAARRVSGPGTRGFELASPQVELGPEVAGYARRTFTPERPVGEAVLALVHRIHADFRYASGVTSVQTTLAEVLDRRAGVCQDFAQLAVACLRWAGLPARYVSGYLETVPPAGQPRLTGADASHAWAAVLLPELGWVDLDPTNDRLVDDSFVTVAWGRDYTDVPPMKGVIFTDSQVQTLDVAVDVTPLEVEPAG